jgi:hypothetical protein
LVYFSGFGILYLKKSGNPKNKSEQRIKEKMKFTKNSNPGLPEFSWYNTPKWEKYTKYVTIKYTKWPQNVPNSLKIDQWPENISKSSIANPSKIYPKLGFLV